MTHVDAALLLVFHVTTVERKTTTHKSAPEKVNTILLIVTRNIALVITDIRELKMRRFCQHGRLPEVSHAVVDDDSRSWFKSGTWSLLDCSLWFQTRTADAIYNGLIHFRSTPVLTKTSHLKLSILQPHRPFEINETTTMMIGVRRAKPDARDTLAIITVIV